MPTTTEQIPCLSCTLLKQLKIHEKPFFSVKYFDTIDTGKENEELKYPGAGRAPGGRYVDFTCLSYFYTIWSKHLLEGLAFSCF